MSLNSFIEIQEQSVSLVLIFDFHNLVYRNLFVSHFEFKNKRNQLLMGETDVEFTEKDMFLYWKNLMISSVIYNIKKFDPDRVVFSLDNKNCWRKEVYPEYKANRKDSRDKSEINFEEFFKVLDHFIEELKIIFPNIITLKIDKAEGDDVVACIVKNNRNNFIIISSDKDMLQLQKYRNVKQYDPIQQKDIVSLNPEKELEIKILSGDSGDNVPPIRKRVGPKTAQKLIEEGLVILQDEECKKNYIRNKILIDFEYIPKEIEQDIIDKYNNYEIKEFFIKNFWEYLVTNKMVKLSEKIQEFSDKLKRLK